MDKNSFQPFTLTSLLHSLPLEDTASPPPTTTNSIFQRVGTLTRTSSQGSGSGERRFRATVECADIYENNVYVGTSDGHILHYVFDQPIQVDRSVLPKARLIKKHIASQTHRRVERMSIVHPLSKLIVHCDSMLMFLSLPNLSPVSHDSIPSLRGVVTFAVDTLKAGIVMPHPSDPPITSCSLCVVKRRSIQFFHLSRRSLERERPDYAIDEDCLTIRRLGGSVCYANRYNFYLLNIRTNRCHELLEVSYGERSNPTMSTSGPGYGGDPMGSPYGNPSASPPSGYGMGSGSGGAVDGRGGGKRMVMMPSILTADQSFFLISPSSLFQDDGGLGMFVNCEGNGTEAPWTWDTFPRSIEIVGHYLLALFRNGEIIVHERADLSKIQTLHPLEYGTPHTLVVTQGQGIPTSHPSLLEKLGRDASIGGEVRAIVVAKEGLMAIPSQGLVDQADILLDQQRVEEAVSLAAHYAQRAPSDASGKESRLLQAELDYVYLKAGFIFLGESLFEEAFNQFERCYFDARILINLFLGASSSSSRESLEALPQGVQTIVMRLGSIQAIIDANVQAQFGREQENDKEDDQGNGVKDSEEGQGSKEDEESENDESKAIEGESESKDKSRTGMKEESNAKCRLRKQLERNAQQAFLTHLQKLKSGKYPLIAKQDVDTALLKLYVLLHDNSMYGFLRGRHLCRFEESSAFLRQWNRMYALSLLLRSSNRFRETLEIWKRLLRKGGAISGSSGSSGMLSLAEMERRRRKSSYTSESGGEEEEDGEDQELERAREEDERAFGGIDEFIELISELKDPILLREYIPWVLQFDVMRGVKILKEMDSSMENSLSSSEIVEMLRAFGDDGLRQYLEHLIMMRGSQDVVHHTNLVQMYISAAKAHFETFAEEEEYTRLVEEEYRELLESGGAGLTYYAMLKEKDDMISQARFKLISFLQASRFWEPMAVKQTLKGTGFATLELVSVYSRIGDNQDALRTLVQIGDFETAERFCLYVGSLSEANASSSGSGSGSGSSPESSGHSTSQGSGGNQGPRIPRGYDPMAQRELFRQLLMLIQRLGSKRLRERRLFHLLSNYGQFISLQDVFKVIPESWSLETLDPFFISRIRQEFSTHVQASLTRGLLQAHHEQVREREVEQIKGCKGWVVRQAYEGQEWTVMTFNDNDIERGES
ncbi:hypothetical protein BJ684DRAFT_15226 [Piptocephalis cylindrospora]|uniref:CNH domain-containing protein n=1 Tax=Piptocephalis cylindrospora TaxID=1907219 RepID=A0A4P9Y665_9FUNG|nr:hypothetical protein BJ684DRAFT_15226 [Piptocephalis cylindrospora]|eukprot:RKP14453.1 hypothetical protein BJ684DRAFT_15226 [Piptocephalis cylindrospora]